MANVLYTNSKEWNKELECFEYNQKDIYYSSEYYKMYEKNQDGIGKCFVYSENKKKVFYPFLLNKIEGYNFDKDYWDIQTVYGYGGPITNCYEEKFLQRFEENFLEFCKENNVVAEFIRFHPILKNNNILKNGIEVIHNRITVPLYLEKGAEAIWDEEFKSENRNRIRKAIKNGLRVERSYDYSFFKEIYEKTMDKVSADSYYYFNDDYYDAMSKNKNLILLYVFRENKIIAGGIFMKYGDYFHYHLGGSLKEYLKFAPNNILMWEAINIACSSGCKCFHFGGGIRDDIHDCLFRFKSGFSKSSADFHIGKRVHNQEIYNYLIKEWERKNDKEAKLFLQYRY